MLMRMIEQWIRLFTDLTLPAASPPLQPDMPEPDGRLFVWIASPFGGMSPQVLHQPGVGGIVQPLFDPIVLKPSEYEDSLSILAARYPAPFVP